ncbi:MAG: Ig-like domain-containing protein [Chloroflexi bacterium]|nr:Ig-like domain-containing protein [Chloroflexota bacterium]
MKPITSRLSHVIIGALFALLVLVAFAGPAGAGESAGAVPVQAIAYRSAAFAPTAITVDGVVDAAYGDPLASDPAGDGNGNANMDLLDLYVAEDASNFYVAFTANADLGATNWGKYMLYVDTTNDGDGATGDAWGRNVVVNNPHKPEYSINSWLDAAPYGTEDIQLWAWNQGTTSWSNTGTVGAAALGAGSTSVIEWQIAKSDLGNPSTIWLEVWNTGGGGGDNAQDTINKPADDWNATDWSTQAVLANSTQYGSPLVDGVIDQVYGDPLASDPAGDGNGNANMDLLDLYVTGDADNFYVAYTVNADIAVTNWGKYMLYVDTTNNGDGATSDAWGRNVVVSDPHKPEYSINSWLDAAPYGTEDIQLWAWNQGTTSWNSAGTIDGAALGASSTSVVEWQIAKADLGNPAEMWLEVWDTGGGGSDNAQDTINDPADDWNASDWSSQAMLDNSTHYPPAGEPPPAEGCQSGAAVDDNIFWNDLGHNSRDTLYRTPGGPVTATLTVTLRLRTACDDLTGAKVRLWNDRPNAELLLPMTRVASDDNYDWWEATLNTGSDPTVYWYRFIAQDGAATAYYEDDAARTGGWGQTFGSSPDNSWQLSVYDPTFQTPDWVKNAVVYQIFADRFRDDNTGNDTPPGTFFYNEPGGTIYRSNQANWNQTVCDPRDPAECPGDYSNNFYGGDLLGIVQELNYLQQLGVTAIYLNPIFESPSNHKYDTTNFGVIDNNFGNLNLFQVLVNQAHSRGINVILDGVFNHTSSDSRYFDRYLRYPPPDGACESHLSDYRDWYYLQDVPAGTGPCVGSDGTPQAANYTSWFGFDSLPKLDSFNQEVRDYIWAGGPNAIARYWMQWADGWRLDVAGDVDPGTINDPNNDYWEGFRDAVHQTNPDAYIVGEEWNVAASWTLGQEWDATMNYQFSSALLSFWRDEPFVDNDHNASSSAGVLNPLSPSQLDERLHNLEERYPPEAFYAMMNLLGSHDTNRALFMLDHNTDLNNSALYDNPAYDWSDAITRLKGVVLLQMTLPGAPTVYYGDEVGLVGPVTYDGSTWQDDPYNRIPYPWLDQSGTPFYTHLQTQSGQDNLRNYYDLLIAARNTHPALRTGSSDTLLVDDANDVYAYGRLLPDYSDAAVVIINRATALTQTVVVDVSGYLPIGGQLVNVMDNNTATIVDGNGYLTVNVPGMGGAVLVTTGALTPPPEAVPDLDVLAERSEEVDLGWTTASGADSYDVYRSLLSGGGYSLITNTISLTYTDAGLQNAVRYYYVVVARDDATGLASGPSEEVLAIPHHNLNTAWYNLQWPVEFTHTISAITPTQSIYGQLWINGATGGAGPATGITAQVGFGISGTLPTDPSWIWLDMVYNLPVGNNDEYTGNLLPDAVGDYHYATRWSSDGRLTWYYSDLSGPGLNGNPGLMHVVPSGDTTAPAAPAGLAVAATTASSISLSWEANNEPDLAGYEIYRQQVSLVSAFVRIAQVGPGTTDFTDDTVTTGGTYDYYVLAYDTSFNRSTASNIVQATAEPRFVEVTFNVTVPPFTQGVVYIVGSLPEIGSWNPGAVPMTQVMTATWTITRTILDGTQGEYKFTRGNWETVEKEADGNTEIPNRQFTVDYGSTGTQTLDLTVANWRDPIVAAHSPAAGATSVPTGTVVTVTWSQAMPTTSDFTVEGPGGPVSGTFGYDAGSYTVTFTPTVPLQPDATYTATVSGKTDVAGDVQQVPVQWTFQTLARLVSVTFNVTVPSGTPGTVTIFGNQPELGNWDPAAVPMTPGGPDTWSISLNFLEGTELEYKFARGSLETVETAADGNTDIANRQLTVQYGVGGTQTVNLAVANWRDPFVIGNGPPAGATGVPVDSTISATWNQAMPATTDFDVTGPNGPVSGAFSYDAGSQTVTFTPAAVLVPGATYTVTVSGQVDVAGHAQQVPLEWTFQTFVQQIYLPFVIAGGAVQAGDSGCCLAFGVQLIAPGSDATEPGGSAAASWWLAIGLALSSGGPLLSRLKRQPVQSNVPCHSERSRAE